MKSILKIGLVMIFLTTPLWAANDQPSQNQPTSPGYGYGWGHGTGHDGAGIGLSWPRPRL